MILQCSCQSLFQDNRYGDGWRVHNYCPPTPSMPKGKYRCTICKRERGKK